MSEEQQEVAADQPKVLRFGVEVELDGEELSARVIAPARLFTNEEAQRISATVLDVILRGAERFEQEQAAQRDAA